MRKGLIKITPDLYEHSWDLIYAMFAELKPTYIEKKSWDYYYRIYGVCKSFRVINEGEEIPEYEVNIHQTIINDKVVYEFEFNEITKKEGLR